MTENRYEWMYEHDRENLIDVSPYFLEVGCGYHNIYGPHKSGKSLLLHAIQSFFDDGSESGSIFDDSEFVRAEKGKYDRNRHPVLFMDFSRFSARTMSEAYRWFRKKMSELYLDVLKRYWGEMAEHGPEELYLDVLEGKCDKASLAHSLLELVRTVRWTFEWQSGHERPLILIDEAARPLVYAEKYGYYEELKPFYDDLLDIDHYELTFGIVTTSFAPIDTGLRYHLKYLRNIPVNDIAPLRKVCSLNGIVLSSKQKTDRYSDFGKFSDVEEYYHGMMHDPEEESQTSTDEIVISQDIQQFIDTRRRWIARRREESEKERIRQEEKSRKEYAAPLPADIKIPSKYAGIREFRGIKHDEEIYRKLNEKLVSLFSKYGNSITQRDVYDAIQNVRAKEDIPDFGKVQEELGRYAQCEEKTWSAHIDSDEYWYRFDFQRKKDDHGFSDLALVKVYLTVRDVERLSEVFCEAVRYLIDNGKHLFHAKLSRKKRDDQMCFWVGREDFFSFEKLIIKYDDTLITPLPFIAYRGKAGISREFYTWDSHNGVQATLISRYLTTIKKEEDIDLFDMYSLYIKAWNGELEESHPFSKNFKSANAQELLILMESLDCILNRRMLADDHILLNGDGELWHALGSSKNWYETGEKLRK